MSSRLLQQLQHRYAAQQRGGEILAVVLHGSAVRTEMDALSDLDLLVITNQTATAFHALWHVDQTPCDLHLTNLPELVSAAQRDVPSNNNFALRAFSTGTLLFQADGAIADHQRAALARWRAGPPAPSAANVYALRQAAMQIDLFLTKCASRSVSDPVWREIQLARSGTFLTQLTDSYCRLKRLWSNAFWILKHETGTGYQPIVDAIHRFLTPDLDQKISTLRDLCGTVIALANSTSGS